MAKLALSRDLLTDFSKLEKRAQNRVAELADKFQRMNALDLRSSKGIHLPRSGNIGGSRAGGLSWDRGVAESRCGCIL